MIINSYILLLLIKSYFYDVILDRQLFQLCHILRQYLFARVVSRKNIWEIKTSSPDFIIYSKLFFIIFLVISSMLPPQNKRNRFL